MKIFTNKYVRVYLVLVAILIAFGMVDYKTSSFRDLMSHVDNLIMIFVMPLVVVLIRRLIDRIIHRYSQKT